MYRYTLEAIECVDGRYAMRFIDNKTKRYAEGIISGNESNVYAIVRAWNPQLKDWDRSVRCIRLTYPKRHYNNLTKGWAYAGCTTDELIAFIRQKLPDLPNESELYHVSTGGKKCPYCGSIEFASGRAVEDSEGDMKVAYCCSECLKTWENIYSLTSAVIEE